jgi:hypothetical protein
MVSCHEATYKLSAVPSTLHSLSLILTMTYKANNITLIHSEESVQRGNSLFKASQPGVRERSLPAVTSQCTHHLGLKETQTN